MKENRFKYLMSCILLNEKSVLKAIVVFSWVFFSKFMCRIHLQKRSVAFIPCATITAMFCEEINANDPFPSHGYLPKVIIF